MIANKELLTSVFQTTKMDIIEKTLSQMKGKKLTDDEIKRFSSECKLIIKK